MSGSGSDLKRDPWGHHCVRESTSGQTPGLLCELIMPTAHTLIEGSCEYDPCQSPIHARPQESQELCLHLAVGRVDRVAGASFQNWGPMTTHPGHCHAGDAVLLARNTQRCTLFLILPVARQTPRNSRLIFSRRTAPTRLNRIPFSDRTQETPTSGSGMTVARATLYDSGGKLDG
jgi:hypothetical protein